MTQHRVFKRAAKRGKISTSWFYGFKLHALINLQGELIDVTLSPGNLGDRKSILSVTQHLFGKLYADRGYLSDSLSKQLMQQNIQLITKPRKNMKSVQLTAQDNAILQKRNLIETVFDLLKNLCQIEHTRHRSIRNFTVNLLSGIVAYCCFPKKPAVNIAF